MLITGSSHFWSLLLLIGGCYLFILLFICGEEVPVVLIRTVTYFEYETICEFAMKIITNRKIYIH